ncbi:unnamed protein product, partial [Prorocentrum cordatum]
VVPVAEASDLTKAAPLQRSWQALTLVLEGSVRLQVAGLPVGTVDRGSAFGETLLLGLDSSLKVDLVANETTTTVAELVRNDFLQVLKGFPSDQLWYQSVLEENLAPEHMLAGTSIAPCPIFKGIAKETLSAVEPCVLRRLYFPGEHLFDEGAPSEALYMLIRGRASVEKAGRVVRYETRKHVSEGGRRRRSMQQLQTGSVLLRPPPQPMQLGDRAQRAKETENEPVVCFGEVRSP